MRSSIMKDQNPEKAPAKVAGSTADQWNAEMDAEMFDAFEHFPPYGMHRHMNVACIAQRLEQISSHVVSPTQIWDRISHYYHLGSLVGVIV
jgi:Chromatin modification-related protein EAF7